MSPEFLLIGAVAVVGVLHTIVPDHWVPITLIARQRGWTKAETAKAAFQAGIGHVVSTLVIAVAVWIGGVAVATRFGHVVDTLASVALIAFGGWIAISALREMRGGGHGHGHGHSHAHDFSQLGGGGQGVHGPELQSIATGHGAILLSIYETGQPPRFRVTGISPTDEVTVETVRDDGLRQIFRFADRGTYRESVDAIPEPHGFKITVEAGHGDHTHTYETEFAEHEHGVHGHDHGDHDHGDEPSLENDKLYMPIPGETGVLVRHAHIHRHGSGMPHMHWHDHRPATAHDVPDDAAANPPLHEHKHKTTARTALLLILGSSPMVEGIPAFFAAGQYGIGLIITMAIVFAASTIATYVVLCVYSTAGLQRVRLGAIERYGEVLSGAFIALVGVAFWIWPVM